MGARGKEFYDKYLSLSAGVEKFERVFQAAVLTRQTKRGDGSRYTPRTVCKCASAESRPAGDAPPHNGVWLADGTRSAPATVRSQGVKRALDVGISGLLLAMFCPLMVVVWLVVRWKMGRPAIFRQQRPGRHARPFVLYKFRTMSDARDPHGALLPDAERLTPLGKFLRRASLDELPQLWNVLRGEMSLVGPRPLLTAYAGALLTRTSTPVTGHAGNHRLGSDPWAKCPQLGGKARPGHVVRRSLESAAGPGHSSPDCMEGPPVRGHQRRGPLHHARVRRFRLLTEECRMSRTGEVQVIGAGGHAKVVIRALQDLGYRVVALFDDDPRRQGLLVAGVPIVGPVERIAEQPRRPTVIAIGENTTRRQIAQCYDLPWLTVVHPQVLVEPSVRLGRGTVVLARAVVQVDSSLGNHVIVNHAATVDHDCVVESHCAPCPRRAPGGRGHGRRRGIAGDRRRGHPGSADRRRNDGRRRCSRGP